MRTEVIGFTVGTLLTILGLAELVPAIVDWSHDHVNAYDFFLNSIICLFFGISLTISNFRYGKTITIRESFLLTTLSWVFLCFFATLPIYMSDLNISFADAFFECVSGLTATGSTVFYDLDHMSWGILIWRSLLQWIGGIGFIAFAIILLPFLRVGGMQLFQTESSDRYEKVMPKSGEIIVSLLQVYIGFTIACGVIYYLLGMSAFDAVNHAMTTMSTGGYSTHDKSFGWFENPLLHYACCFFMIVGALPFILYIKLFFQGRFDFFKDDQVKAFLAITFVFFAILGIRLYVTHDYGFEEAFRMALFNVISVITTTGYATVDYTGWDHFSLMFFFFITYFGGCAGSTSGGIKTMRVVLALKAVLWQFKTIIYPHGVFTLRYQGRPVNQALVSTVLGFLSLFVVANVVLTVALTFVGVDFETAISAAATVMANVGPGVGDVVGPSGNFSSLPDSAKWILSAGMILGRLEILTILILFTPYYWKK